MAEAAPGGSVPLDGSAPPVLDGGHLRLVLITPDDRPAAATAQLIEAALAGGVTAVLLRERALLGDGSRDGSGAGAHDGPRDGARDELEALARRARSATREAGAALLVSHDVELALAVGADGVQLGHGAASVAVARARAREAGRPLAIGRSAHWPLVPDDDVADYLMLSPFAPTHRSRPRACLTDEQVRDVLARAQAKPVVALGGLTAANVGTLPRELAGVAVIRAVAAAEDPQAAARALRAAVTRRGLGGLAGTARGSGPG